MPGQGLERLEAPDQAIVDVEGLPQIGRAAEKCAGDDKAHDGAPVAGLGSGDLIARMIFLLGAKKRAVALWSSVAKYAASGAGSVLGSNWDMV